jgi:transcriptional regulator with XRE-family HTH domain
MRGHSVDNAVDRVAEKVKRWRMEAGLSLQEVANRSGVSPSTIHKIEHRHTVPTIAVVLRLVHGLGRQASELFDETEREHAATCVRRSERLEARGASGACLQTLAGERDFRSMGIWRMVQPVGTEIGCESVRCDQGEIILYLEEGELLVDVDGLEYALEAGDSLHFDSPYRYSWQNTGRQPAVALVLSSDLDSVQPILSSPIFHPEDQPTPSNQRISIPVAESLHSATAGQ